VIDLPFELHIALRYLLAKRKQAFISVISLVSTVGVTVGVMATIIALAIMTGLQDTLRDRILGSQPHIYVSRPGGMDDYRAEIEKLRAMPRITGVAPALLGKALITASRGEDFITVKGIDPALEPTVTDISKTMKAGSLAALARPAEPPADGVALDGIVLGKDLAEKLSVAVGDSVILTTPEGRLSPLGYNPARRRAHAARPAACRPRRGSRRSLWCSRRRCGGWTRRSDRGAPAEGRSSARARRPAP